MRVSISQFANFLVPIALAALCCVSSCSDETSTGPTVASDLASIDPGVGGNVLLGAASLEDAPRVRVDVWGEDLTIESETVVSFALVIVNRSGRTLYPPATFEISAIKPEGVVVKNADSEDETSSIFDLDDYFGDDNALDPGEKTSPLRIEFEVPGLVSFSFRFNVSAEVPGNGSISGTVFDDINRDGRFDPAMERGLVRESVVLYTSPTEDNPSGLVDYISSNDKGAYAFDDLPQGLYRIEADATRGLIPTTPEQLFITLIEGPHGEIASFSAVDFGYYNPDPPDSLWLVRLDVHGGTEQEDIFINPTSPANHRYVLVVSEPIYIRAPIGALYGGRVWINDTLVYEFGCDDPYSDWQCLGNWRRRIDLPPELIGFGENHIKVAVDGWGEPVLFFSVKRLPED